MVSKEQEEKRKKIKEALDKLLTKDVNEVEVEDVDVEEIDLDFIEKKKCIREIKEDLSNIHYWRENFVFDEELDLDTLQVISRITSKLWQLYYELYKEKK